MSFSQRVKSISMGKFTPDEVTRCVEGGNEVAASTYLATWKGDGDAARPVDK